MAAIAHSPHSRRSKRRKLSRTSLGWVTLARFPGFVCSCCKNHRSCPHLGATPYPLVPGVGIPFGHKASLTPLQEPTHRPCSLLLVPPPRKTLKPQRIRIRLQLEALRCFLQSTAADLCSRFGTRQPSLSYNPRQPPCISNSQSSRLYRTPRHHPSRLPNPVYALTSPTSSRLIHCLHEAMELYPRLSSIDIESCPHVRTLARHSLRPSSPLEEPRLHFRLPARPRPGHWRHHRYLQPPLFRPPRPSPLRR